MKDNIETLLLTGVDVSVGNIHACKLNKHPNTGWWLDEDVFQVSFYDRDMDFEVSNIYENVEDAVIMFLELMHTTTILTIDGFRIKAPQQMYNRVLAYKPSSCGEVGKRRLATKPKRGYKK